MNSSSLASIPQAQALATPAEVMESAFAVAMVENNIAALEESLDLDTFTQMRDTFFKNTLPEAQYTAWMTKQRNDCRYLTVMGFVNSTLTKRNELGDEITEVHETLIEHMDWQLGDYPTPDEIAVAMESGTLLRLQQQKLDLRTEYGELDARCESAQEVGKKIKNDEKLGVKDMRIIKECQDWGDKDDNLYRYMQDLFLAQGIPFKRSDFPFSLHRV